METRAPSTAMPPKDEHGLEHVLRRLCDGRSADYGRPLTPGPAGDAILQRVLQEIDETVLPRRLTISCRPGGAVRMVVSNRRLVTLDLDGEDAAEWRPACGDPVEAARHFAGRLSRVLRSCSEARLMRPERIGTFEPSGVSCSARLLAAAAEVADHRHSAKTAGGDFHSLVAKAALARIEVTPQSDTPERHGPGDLVAGLDDLLERIRSGQFFFPHDSRFRPEGSQCLAAPLTATTSLLVAVHQGAWIIALLPGDSVDEILGTWAG